MRRRGDLTASHTSYEYFAATARVARPLRPSSLRKMPGDQSAVHGESKQTKRKKNTHMHVYVGVYRCIHAYIYIYIYMYK